MLRALALKLRAIVLFKKQLRLTVLVASFDECMDPSQAIGGSNVAASLTVLFLSKMHSFVDRLLVKKDACIRKKTQCGRFPYR